MHAQLKKTKIIKQQDSKYRLIVEEYAIKKKISSSAHTIRANISHQIKKKNDLV